MDHFLSGFLSDLALVHPHAETRSICAENPDGARGGGVRLDPPEGIAAQAARDLGKGWKVNGLYCSQQRFGLYHWHLLDPVRFHYDLRITIQALGWRDGGRYLSLQDDISSTAFWYQSGPTGKQPPLPDRDGLELI